MAAILPIMKQTAQTVRLGRPTPAMGNFSPDVRAKQASVASFLRKQVGTLNVDLQLKAHLAGCFIRDGADYLELFERGWQSERNNQSYRAKLCVTLRTAVECFLKGLVVVHSGDTESPEEAYIVARAAGHRIGDLLKEVGKRSKSARACFSPAYGVDIASLEVGIRYEVDLVHAWSQETLPEEICSSGRISGTIGSDEWLIGLFDRARRLGNRAKQLFDRKLGLHTAYLLSDAEARLNRMMVFGGQVGLYKK
jgi:hypothetical protein